MVEFGYKKDSLNLVVIQDDIYNRMLIIPLPKILILQRKWVNSKFE